MKIFTFLTIVGLAVLNAACGSQEIPQAHKGRMFDRTGALAVWSGGTGFTGPILGPGTHYTGVYDEVKMVDCSQNTVKETLTALTKDGVQFGIDMYLRYSANCDENASVEALLSTLSPDGVTPQGTTRVADPAMTISADQIYRTYLRPALGEAVRESTSPFIANDINSNREKIFGDIKKLFESDLKAQSPAFVVVYEISLNNLDFPETLDNANVARAEQAILKDKAIAERERVDAEVMTMKNREALAKAAGDVEAVKIDKVGAALRRNPEYVMLQMYQDAGKSGNLILAAPTPPVITLPVQRGTPEEKK